MKRYKGLYEKIYSFENLLLAAKKAKKGTSNKKNAGMFFFYLEPEILKLQEELITKTYSPGGYTYFEIKDPKRRTIAVAPFRDRVIHHGIVNIIEPIYEKSFIYHSYATRKEKGTHKAVAQAQKYLKNNYWYFKTDIEKYFDNINHEILLGFLQKKFKDKDFIYLLKKVICSGGKDGKGLPIGNLTSQFLANVYLNDFDHYVLNECKPGGYIRYMDDFVFFSNDKETLKDIQRRIVVYLNKHQHLSLKPKSTFFNSRLNGLPFLGRRIFPSTIRIKRENLKRSLRKIKLREWEYKTGKISEEKLVCSVTSIHGYISSCHTEALRKTIF